MCRVGVLLRSCEMFGQVGRVGFVGCVGRREKRETKSNDGVRSWHSSFFHKYLLQVFFKSVFTCQGR